MPQSIGNHGLYCPEYDDYPAVALYMQDLGTKIDAALAAQLAGFTGFLSPPVILLTNTNIKTIPISSSIDNVFDTILVNTSTFMDYNFTTNELTIGSTAGAPVTVPYPRGAYSAGAGVRMSATGGVTVGSVRELSLRVADTTALPPPGFSELILTQPIDSAADQNTGGNYGLEVKTNFTLTGTSGVRITHAATSGNAASSVTIPAGAAYMWCIFNGATDVIEVA